MRKHSRHGGALLLCIIVTLVILGISGAFLSFSSINSRKTATDMFGLQALYIAESGAALYISRLNAATPPAPATLSNGQAVTLSGGTFAYPAAGLVDYGSNGVDDDNLNGPDDDYEKNFVRFEVDGTFSGVTRRLEILLSRAAGGVFWNAVFAGNSSGSAYSLQFNSGVSGSGDVIKGDVYSGGDVWAQGNAQLLNEVGQTTGSTVMYAGNNIGGPTGPTYKQGTQSDLDLSRNAQNRSKWEEYALQNRIANSAGVGRNLVDGSTQSVSYFDVAWDLQQMGSTASGANNGGAQSDQASGSNGGLGRANAQINNRNEPSHIFRKDPTQPSSNNDRTTNYAFVDTAKSDYYIEDPTNTGVKDISNLGYAINGDTTASSVNISPNGNNAVYFVDGNLWVSHDSLKSYQWAKPAGMGDMKVTIVVKGNVNFTDNLVYANYQSDSDALAILAIKDDARLNTTSANFLDASAILPGTNLTVAEFVTKFNERALTAGNDTTGARKIADLDINTPAGRERAASEFNRANGSGNIFYGDPGSGTVEYFESFMYAENNFYATNLDSTTASGGTQRVEIFGNMTAGNHVSIMRDSSKVGYIPLMVSFDDRIRTPGAVKPPALPTTPGFGSGDWLIASWKQIP
jgi:hypothetical protein